MAYILKSSTKYMELGLVAFTMTLIIIAGQIDLSVASIMACVATFTAMMFHAGMDMGLACVIGLAIAFGFGTFNGVLVAYANLPSMIVTIGTMSLFRGLSQIFIGDASLGKFPDWFNSVEKIPVFKAGNAVFGVTILLFIIMAVVFFFILHKTSIGRKIYAIGTNERAAVYSGVNTKKIKCLLFSFSGLMAGLAGILTMSRLLLVRFDMADGGELDIVTMVPVSYTHLAHSPKHKRDDKGLSTDHFYRNFLCVSLQLFCRGPAEYGKFCYAAYFFDNFRRAQYRSRYFICCAAGDGRCGSRGCDCACAGVFSGRYPDLLRCEGCLLYTSRCV